MKFTEDYSHINKSLIDRGLYDLTVYQLRIHGSEEEVVGLLDDLEFDLDLFIYQYKSEYGYGTHDLFFWCNTIFENGGHRRDFRFVTLGFNSEKSLDFNSELLSRVLEYLAVYDAATVNIVVQYGQRPRADVIEKEARRICDDSQGRFVYFSSLIGRIWYDEERFYFKKKGAKTHYFIVSPIDICARVRLED